VAAACKATHASAYIESGQHTAQSEDLARGLLIIKVGEARSRKPMQVNEATHGEESKTGMLGCKRCVGASNWRTDGA